MMLAQQIIWAISLGLLKLSILTLYSKIFSVDYFILAARVTTVIIVLWYVLPRATQLNPGLGALSPLAEDGLSGPHGTFDGTNR